MSPTLPLLAALLVGQAEAPKSEKADEGLDLMKSVASTYQFTRDDPARQTLRLRPEPSFRMGRQPADNIHEGAIFFWLGEAGRPEVAAQIFEIRDANFPDGLWIHEFISLSPAPLIGERQGGATWSPRKPGVEFRPIPGAPRPGDTPAKRATQMRALARDFGASDHFHEKTWIGLRLLPTPVARYGAEDSPILDGSMFALVTGTDPEAFLFVEARSGDGGPGFFYAFAPMTCWELKGTLKGDPVWTIACRRDAHDLTQPYVTLTEPAPAPRSRPTQP